MELRTLTMIIITIKAIMISTMTATIIAAIIYTDWTPVEDVSSICVGSVVSHSNVEEVEDTQAPSNVRGRSWTGMVTPEEAHSCIIVMRSATGATSVPCSCAW